MKRLSVVFFLALSLMVPFLIGCPPELCMEGDYRCNNGVIQVCDGEEGYMDFEDCNALGMDCVEVGSSEWAYCE